MSGSSESQRDNARLERLRAYRNRPDPDLSLAFLSRQFKQQVARPHKQLAAIIEHWQRLVPAELLEHTRLDALSRGVLRVAVDSSAHLYELDRLLRNGIERELIAASKVGTLRKVKLHVAEVDRDIP